MVIHTNGKVQTVIRDWLGEPADTQSVSPSVGHHPAQQGHFTVQISNSEARSANRVTSCVGSVSEKSLWEHMRP